MHARITMYTQIVTIPEAAGSHALCGRVRTCLSKHGITYVYRVCAKCMHT
jgi:hypothetical protein